MTEDLVEQYRELNRETRSTDLRVLLANGLAGITEAVEEACPTVRVPTLILWAENDILFPVSSARHLDRVISDSVTTLLPQRGHCLQEENREGVSRELRAFLDRPSAQAADSEQRS